MKKNQTNGYIAGGIFLFLGILFLIVGFEQTWNSGKYTVIIGGFISILGIGGLLKPETIGHVIATWMNNLFENNNKNHMNHNNNRINIKSKHSNYTGNAGKVYNINNYNSYKANYKQRK